jgi:hypothetical protein
MRICYLGELPSIIKNLQELGAEVSFQPSADCDGIIVTDTICAMHLVKLRNLWDKPIIVKGQLNQYYTNINVLVLDENETKEFYEMHKIKTLQECKDTLRDLKIHYLVVALTKEQIQHHVKYNLPKAYAKDVKITNEQVATAKDSLTALVGYIYIKERTLSAEAINKANVGAALSVAGLAEENLKDYYLDIKLKK